MRHDRDMEEYGIKLAWSCGVRACNLLLLPAGLLPSHPMLSQFHSLQYIALAFVIGGAWHTILTRVLAAFPPCVDGGGVMAWATVITMGPCTVSCLRRSIERAPKCVCSWPIRTQYRYCAMVAAGICVALAAWALPQKLFMPVIAVALFLACQDVAVAAIVRVLATYPLASLAVHALFSATAPIRGLRYTIHVYVSWPCIAGATAVVCGMYAVCNGSGACWREQLDSSLGVVVLALGE